MYQKKSKKPLRKIESPILISACLIGERCYWNEKSHFSKKAYNLLKKKKYIKLCPEVLGGLTIPRLKTEIKNGEGADVLNRKAKVYNEKGVDVTKFFLKGARLSKKIAIKNNVKVAILKSNSPSCGVGNIYDGSFSKKLRKGDGVTTAILKKIGVKVVSDKNLKKEELL
jgi:uncharacterized protein YbbK (DUF523 family)